MERPPSDEMVDLHVLIMPASLWRADLRFAYSNTCLESISTGFIRVYPETTLYALREEIARQLDARLIPHGYMFLRNVGRCLTLVTTKQETSLKAKIFVPPLAPCPEIYVLDTKCLGGEVLPPVQKKRQSRKQEPSTCSYSLPSEAKSHGETTAGLAVTHMTPLSQVHQMQPAAPPHPYPGSWDNAPAINALPHASPAYQAGYLQQMLGNSYENDPHTIAGTLPVASVHPPQGRPSHLQPFQLAVNPTNPINPEGIHVAYGRYDPHLQMGNHVITDPSTTQPDSAVRFQTNAPMQYHELFSHLHPLRTHPPSLHVPPSSSNDSQESTTSDSSSNSSESESDPHNRQTDQRAWVSSDDPEVIQTAAALERILFGDEVAADKHQNKASNEVSDAVASYPVRVRGGTEPKNKAGDTVTSHPVYVGRGTEPGSDAAATQAIHWSDYKKQPEPHHKIAEPKMTQMPNSPNNVAMAAHFQGQNTAMIGPMPQKQLNHKGAAAVSLLYLRPGPATVSSDQANNSVPVPTPVGADVTRRSMPTVAAKAEKGVRKRTQTHPPHSKSTKIFDRREFGYSRITSDVSKSNLQQSTVHVPHPKGVHGAEKHLQQPSTRNAPLPSIRGSGDEPSSLHKTAATSFSHDRPSTGEVNDLLAQMRLIKQECEELASTKATLGTNLRSLQHMLKTRREDADKEWKRQFFQEKKLTSSLDDQIKRAKDNLQAVQGEIDHKRESHLKDSICTPSVAVEAPSEHSNIKIQCRRLELNLQDMRQRMEAAKQRLATEREAHRTLTAECRSLRKEVTKMKIACTRTRGQPVITHS